MKKLRETNWKYRYMAHPVSKPYKYPRITILRYAITPTGRKSKYWASICRYREDVKDVSEMYLIKLSESMQLPKLPKGYTWSEPFLM